MKNKEKKKVLISEDESISAELFRSFIEDLGHTVVSVTHRTEDTLQQIYKLHPHIVFLDINMEYKTAGIDVCKIIKEKYSDIKVYFLTAYDKSVFEEELKNISYDGYVDKLNFMNIMEDILVGNEKENGNGAK